MPRLVCDAFLDPSNTATSIAASPSRVINEYLEGVQPGHGKSPGWRVRRPGLHRFVTLPTGPVRGVFEINARMFAVGGAHFYEVLSDATVTHVSAVADDTLPVSMASNGSAGDQVLVISAGLGYIYDLTLNTLTLIADADFPPNARGCEFMDGYFLVSQGAGSRSIQWSALEDGTSWDPLDVIEVSITPDNVTAIIRNHKEIWVFGFRNTEVLVDSGDPTAVFEPYQGVVIEIGAQGIFTPQRLDNTIFWMTQGEQGDGMVMRADGYTPKRVSTHAVEVDLQRADTPTDAVACAFQINGHLFYCLTLPRNETSWVYDATTDRWFEWAHWDPVNLVWVPFLGQNHVFVFDKHLMGSRVDGTIYELSQDFLGRSGDEPLMPPVLLANGVGLGGNPDQIPTSLTLDTRGATFITAAYVAAGVSGDLDAFSDDLGNTWTKAPGYPSPGDGYAITSGSASFYSCYLPTTSATHTFTADSSDVAVGALEVQAWGGITSVVYDTQMYAHEAPGFTLGPHTFNGLVFAYGLYPDGDTSAPGYVTFNSGTWTVVDTQQMVPFGFEEAWGNAGLVAAYKVLSTPTSLSTTWNWSTGGYVGAAMFGFTYSDAPAPATTTYPIRRLVRFMLPWDDANRMKFLSRLEIVMQAGIGTTDVTAPAVMLRLSKDGGLTWGNEIDMNAGAMGEFTRRVYANRLSRGRNWVAEVTVSDPVDWQMLQCLVDYEEGTS
jgi:hypothetical protein